MSRSSSTTFRLKRTGKEYKACCPFHDEKTPSFTVVPDKQFFHCFGCGAHGTAVGFLMDYANLEFVEAVEELARRTGREVPREVGGDHGPVTTSSRSSTRWNERTRTSGASSDATAGVAGGGVSQAARPVGKDRFGVPPRLRAARVGRDPPRARGERACRAALVRAGLLVAGDGGRHYDRFRDRITFPIHDSRGRVAGFGARIIDSGEPKYLNSPETPVFRKGRELYGLWRARRAGRSPARLLVVEGYMDVVALAQSGIDCAVATLGTAATETHIQRLFRAVNDIVFCFDGDEAGRRAAWRAVENALPALKAGRQAAVPVPSRRRGTPTASSGRRAGVRSRTASTARCR